ncbi:MAG: lactonase family protein [Bacteroidetes bacterium]|nr:lactonase family protein [Bacteroidota bacterium]
MNIRSLIVLVAFVLSGLFAKCQPQSNEKLYVGTFTSEGAEGIYLCDFNSETGDISLDKTFKGIDNPSFLKVSADKKYLYAVSRTTEDVEKSGGFAIAYKIEKNGNLHFVNRQISNGAGPCHIDVSPDGKFAAIATYSGGTTSVYPINGDGSLSPASSIIINKSSGSDKSRQDVAHAHSIKFSVFDGNIYSADLGTDQLNIYSLENGKLISAQQKFVKMKDGAGPRHFELHPNGEIIYVINELNSTITVLEKQNGTLIAIQDISTLPAGFNGESYCADIHLSKDGKFIYGSNRGHNSIAVFSVDADSNKLKFKETVSVEGDWPRNFTLSPNGKFMLVANQKRGNITVFKIHPKTGIPKFTGKEIKLPASVCLEFL